ncbi:rRNA maturation RNase YbeY [Patescibacteria group bacterium]|nr:rRNA maturation RNase YbeY [Patescibacteria group bacterium]MBU1890415.1 rRNA maturation RNase YbeY [Patescibacteria group bacterium]
MNIEITSFVGRVELVQRKAIITILKRAVRDLRLPGQGELSLVFVSAKEINRLNKLHRKHNCATTNLSFSSLDIVINKPLAKQLSKIKSKDLELHYGEIFLCPSEIVKYAKQSDLSCLHALVYLTLHSFLHLVGYKHTTSKDEKKMNSVMNKILDQKYVI